MYILIYVFYFIDAAVRYIVKVARDRYTTMLPRISYFITDGFQWENVVHRLWLVGRNYTWKLKPAPAIFRGGIVHAFPIIAERLDARFVSSNVSYAKLNFTSATRDVGYARRQLEEKLEEASPQEYVTEKVGCDGRRGKWSRILRAKRDEEREALVDFDIFQSTFEFFKIRLFIFLPVQWWWWFKGKLIYLRVDR